jgi:subtilase family serine protease
LLVAEEEAYLLPAPVTYSIGGTKRGFKNIMMANLRFLALCMVASGLTFPMASNAQEAPSAVRIVNRVDENQLVMLKGNTHPSANAKNDLGIVNSSLSMPDLTLVLSRGSEQQAAFEAFVASQYDSGSPNYHRWLMPEEIGAKYGPAQADITTISNWLTGHGFAVSKIAKDRMSIRFSGTAGQVESTFHTQIHTLSVNGVTHIGNMSDPQIPGALASVVTGIKALHNFLPRPLHRAGSTVQFNREAGKWQRIASTASANSTSVDASKSTAASSPHPQFGINTSSYLEEDVVPYDFATIYNVLPLWNAGITGKGQSIAIAGTSEINLNDVTTFRNAFGLPAGLTPQQIDTNGLATECTSTSGSCSLSDLEENSLDVEWSGAVATGAQIVLVVTGQNAAGTVDTLYDSENYVVENLTAKILNVSYGECELGMGTSGNVAYYNLWQSAAAEGISVFVATGDAGSPVCDQNGSSYYGYPYSAQYGLSVSGMASTPYNTAVGGTDFSWCKPTLNSKGAVVGCPTASSSASPYWNSTNNAATGASASGYIPEIPWNDTCMNPIIADYLASFAPFVVSATNNAPTPTNAEGACNFVQNNWSAIYTAYNRMFAPWINTVGGSGGASGCIVNDSQDPSSCSTSTTSTGNAYGSIPLSSDGWQKPSWQTGVTGIPADGVRDIPDVSFFAGAGSLESAYLFCVSNTNVGSCSYSDTSVNTAEEAGGTSFASPAMAGVMALINQKAGAAQGNPNSQLYELAAKQTYSECSAESVTSSSSCYFNDIDTGTIAMPCDLGATIGGYIYVSGSGWETNTPTAGTNSPNCTAVNSGDWVGTLTNSSGKTAYDAVTGFDLATGLGSLNVSNVVNAWTSESSAATASVSVTPSASAIFASSTLTVTVKVTGSDSLGTPTGSVVLAGGGYSTSQGLTSGGATITIPANSLSTGTDTLTASYSGDSNYAAATSSATVTVTDASSVTVTPASTTVETGQSLGVTATVSGANGTPTGTAKLATGSYTSSAAALNSSGTAAFTIPADSLTAGTATLTVTYSGDSNYASSTGTATLAVISSTYSLAATTPAAVSPGATASSTVTVTSATDYSGTITLTCTATSTPANATYVPTCTAGSTVAMTNGTARGTATLKIATTGNTAMLQPMPRGGEWIGATGGGVLAFLVFLGIPARRRNWRALVGVLVCLIALGGLSACGGSGSSKSTTQTTAGSYTFTVKGQGNDPASTTESTTFTLTVN